MLFNSQLIRLQNRKSIFILLLFISTLFFRSPTLFNDFYDVDELAAIVQTREYISGQIPGKDYRESKKPVYHLIFNKSYEISNKYGYAIVHFISILFIFFTSLFIYLTGSYVYNFKTGALAGIFYSVFISSFNKDFMATNGEVIYNLFLAGGLYFIIRSISARLISKIGFFILTIIFAYLAFQVKFQGIILIIYICFFYIFYYPYFKYSTGKKGLFVLVITLIFSFLISLFGIKLFLPELYNKIFSLMGYAVAAERKFTFLNFISRFVYKQTLFFTWHMLLWVPVLAYLLKFIRNLLKSETIEESAIVIFFILSYLMIFTGFARLYFHYFMISYIGLSLLASNVLFDPDKFSITFIRKRMTVLLLIPAIFFLSWNVKDIVIKHYFPNGFYKEGKFLFWTRAVLTGRYNEYLLPKYIYKNTIDYIRKITIPGDRIYVWGNGPEIYYFSERNMGGYDLWPKSAIFQISNLYKKNNKESVKAGQQIEKSLIKFLKLKKPLIFVETSGAIDIRTSNLSLLRPAYFDIPLTDSKLIHKYVDKNYKLINEINGIKIYKRI